MFFQRKLYNRSISAYCVLYCCGIEIQARNRDLQL